MPAVIEVQNLHKTYGDTVAVDDVSFTCDRLPAHGRSARRTAAGGPGRGPGRRGALALGGGPADEPVPRARRGPAQPAGTRGPGDGGGWDHQPEAAARLFISEATVKTHLLNIYGKLGVSDRAAAVAEAFNRGLLTPEVPER